MSAIEGLIVFVWVVTGVWLYLARRRRRPGGDWRSAFWFALGAEFCWLAFPGGVFVLRHFGHTAMFIWIFSTFGLGIAFTALSVYYDFHGKSGTG